VDSPAESRSEDDHADACRGAVQDLHQAWIRPPARRRGAAPAPSTPRAMRVEASRAIGAVDSQPAASTTPSPNTQGNTEIHPAPPGRRRDPWTRNGEPGPSDSDQ
jgi:hypothetical protein